MEDAIVKTVAGFLNTDGGTLLIGVNDRREPIGLRSRPATRQAAERGRLRELADDAPDQRAGHTLS